MTERNPEGEEEKSAAPRSAAVDALQAAELVRLCTVR